MGIVFLRLLLVFAKIGVTGLCFDIRIFGAHVPFSSLERQFNCWSGPFAFVWIPEQGNLHVLIPETQEGLQPIAGNTGQLDEQCLLHVVLHAHGGFRLLSVFSRNSSTKLWCTCLALDVSQFSLRIRWGVRTPSHSLLVSKSMTQSSVSNCH
jgi:hypothetical protein